MSSALSRTERRALEQAAAGKSPLTTPSGAARAMVRRLNAKGFLQGHVLTLEGKAALDAR